MCCFGWIVRIRPSGPIAVSASLRPGGKVQWRCAISFWEVAMLAARGRIELRQSPESWRGDWLRAGLVEIALDGALAVAAAELAEFHPDPADRFIAATAMARAATLITADQALLRWPGPLLCHPAGT